MKPQPLHITDEFYERCTCNEYAWGPHECPFKAEIEESDELCTCCPYCEGECNDEV